MKRNMLEENIMTVRQAIEISNTGDISRVDEVISPNYFDDESQADPFRSKLRGPEAFIETVKMLRSAFADLHYEEQEVFSALDKVAVVTRVTGEHTGNFFVIPPSGNKIDCKAVHIFKIGDNGKIVEHKAVRDDLRLMMQIGVVGTKGLEWKGL
jgi:predicted ester cyclase